MIETPKRLSFFIQRYLVGIFSIPFFSWYFFPAGNWYRDIVRYRAG